MQIHTGEILSGFLHIAILIWPFWLLVVAVGLFRLAVTLHAERRLRASGIYDIDGMTGMDFERRLVVLFRDLGFSVQHVGNAAGDFGADLVLEGGRRRVVVQAKCWSKNIGVKAVQEVHAARSHYHADEAWVVTNRDFTAQARMLASSTRVDLWNRERLVAALRKANRVAEQASATASVVAEPGRANV